MCVCACVCVCVVACVCALWKLIAKALVKLLGTQAVVHISRDVIIELKH